MKTTILFLALLTLHFNLACEEKIERVQIGNAVSPIKLSQKDFFVPKKIILVIGDGVGFNHIKLARLFEGGPKFNTAVDRMPISGIVTNYSFDDLYTDSAASGTAWATGVKTKNRFLGIDSAKQEIKNISEILDDYHYHSGLVATSSVTHASPAAHYAHIDNRYKEEAIATQLTESTIKIALGGGRKFFRIKNTDKLQFYLDFKKLKSSSDSGKKIIGLFADSGINRGDGPTQLAMTKVAVKYLESSSGDCGRFFLMTEGSQIDWESHDNRVQPMLDEYQDFNNTINYLLGYASNRNDTLIVVTSDHETGGLNLLKQDQNEVIISWSTDRHTLAPIGVFAYGPGAEMFSGTFDHVDIFGKIIELADKTPSESCDKHAE